MKKITPLSTLNFPFSNSRGFTLVELLVSISIIAVLTALLTANFVGAKQRGRDGQRKANAYNMQSALELYRADVGTYPLTLTGCGTALKSPTGTTYMQKLPCDPSTNAGYYYNSTDGVTYKIITCLENREDSDKSTDSADTSACASPTVPFTLINP
jgi:type II secretion system protein G